MYKRWTDLNKIHLLGERKNAAGRVNRLDYGIVLKINVKSRRIKNPNNNAYVYT